MDSDAAAGSRSPDAAGSRRPTKRQARSLPDRAMLDCYLRPLRHHDNSTLVYVSTATGGKIGVGLVAATPPKVSYLLYHWIADEGRRGSSHKAPEIPGYGDAKAMAAHRNSILLSFLFPMNKGGTFPDMSEEFFVYQATVVPTLKKLPACHHTFMNCDTTKNSGILCRESGGLFVVAHLNVHSERRGRGDYRVTAELCRIFGEEEAGPWHTTKCVPICLDESQRKDLIWWETDAVIPFGDFICWVDYLRGILFCNVFSQDHPEVKFVPLPISPYPGRCHPDLGGRGALSACRSVCVTKDGESMKFIDVGHLDCWFHGRQRGVPRPPIKSWTLTSERLWREDVMMEEADFFALIMDNRLLTHSQMKDIGLVSPFVHMRDPEIIYLVLEGGPQPCLLEVNMKSRTMNTVPSCKIASFGSSYMHSNSTSFGLSHYEQPLPLSLAAPNITT